MARNYGRRCPRRQPNSPIRHISNRHSQRFWLYDSSHLHRFGMILTAVPRRPYRAGGQCR
ncbi:MAG: hypothetical protein IPO91_01495 [Chloroflexi bacterium]|nr:hypothetical protein [Chloroflexota bacterium]